MSKFDKYVRTMPKIYNATLNPVVRSLLKAWATGDDEIVTQLQNTKSQLFVRTAEGRFLNRLGSGLGVSRPNQLGLFDSEFQELIPNLSLKPKQIRKAFYDTMDVFWGPLFSRTNVTSNNEGPYNLSPGDTFEIFIDGASESEEVEILPGDIASPGAATADEIAEIISRINGITASVIEDQVTNNKSVNVRTDTPGARGSITIPSSPIADELGFPIKRLRITDLDQRTVMYEIRPRELIIELPAILPSLRRTLKGSHHFHADSTLQGPVAPANETWEGSFFFDPGGVSYAVSGQKAETEENLIKGDVYTKVTVDDASNIPNEPGFLIFDWGKENEEQPVKYLGRPNDKTILLDPGYQFQKTHLSGTSVNVLSELSSTTPAKDGDDLPIYLTSPSGARQVVQEILRTLAAAGVIINFIILLPQYDYICGNPYE